MIKNWVAPRIPGAGRKHRETYRESVYWVPRHAGIRFTGYYNPPVPVIRCRVREPIFKLELGRLEAGLYAIRVIGAVEKKNLRGFLLPAFLAMCE